MTAPHGHTDHDLQGRLTFIREAERLKHTLRSAYTASGDQESSAEHSWRLCLLAMTMQDLLGPLNFERVLKLCVLHDLGEALGGDVPAVVAHNVPDKAERERRDLQTLCATLPPALQAEFLALHDEYENASSPEARVVKALDKMETILQHHQGANPPGFDHRYNLVYGRHLAAAHPVLQALRELIDADTRQLLSHQDELPLAGGSGRGD